MYRGTTTFTCDNCGNRFLAPDIEWNMTIFSVPQPCPKCGSLHTYQGVLPWNKWIYNKIFKT